MDEAGFSLHPKLGSVWAKKGSKPQVPTASNHKRLNLMGWVAPWKGWHGLMRIDKGNRQSFIAFLKHLNDRLRDWTVFLYADGASWHKGEQVKRALEELKNIHLQYLPAYHPEQNPQERIWKLIRYEVTTNHYFQDIDEIDYAIRCKQRQIKPKRIHQLCCVT
jgi:transposase